MEWDQALFKKLHTWWKRWTAPTEQEPREQEVTLESLHSALILCAQALTGEPIQIHRAEREGGCAHQVFFLPAQCHWFSSQALNRWFYFFRICFLSQEHLWLRAADSLERLERTTLERLWLKTMLRKWPGGAPQFRELWLEARSLQGDGNNEPMRWLLGRTIGPGELEDTKIHHAPQHPEENEEEEAHPITELKAAPCEEVQMLAVDQEAIEQRTLLHQFEKVETLDEFAGQWREMDGADELEEHAEALEELRMSQVVRSDVPTHSVLQADYLGSGTLLEVESKRQEEPSFVYPEWDSRRRRYLKEHCTVFAKQASDISLEYVGRTLEEHAGALRMLRRKLQSFRNEREKRRRQLDGELLDIPALVDDFAERRAGFPPRERVYLSSRKARKELSVLVLLDCSLSTDAYLDNQRILDVEKQAMLLFGQLLSEEGERFQVDAFSSHTRHQCQVTTLKSFRESWSTGASKVGGLRPSGYTRIGPALRHATAQMQQSPSRHRWILLLSDGKPNDYDRYEGKHGVADVRQAIREAHQRGIQVYAMAVAQEAQYYFPRMLGHSNYRILPHPRDLPDAMLYFYTRLLGKQS